MRAVQLRRPAPLVVAAVALLAGLLLVVLRWGVAAEGDLTRFVVAGSGSTSAQAPLAVLPGPGYDGQFIYRMAVAPFTFTPTAAEVTVDGPLRLQRLTYPLLAHVLAAGNGSWVPVSLVAVNLLALAALGLLGAVLARDAGRSPWAGLLLPAFSGFVLSLSRNLTELVTAALLAAAVLAWQRGRRGWTSAAMAGAVLSRETVVLVVAAFVLAEAARQRRVRVLVVAVGPALAFLGWQALVWHGYGAVPLLDSGGRNLVLPFRDLLPAAGEWAAGAAELDRQALVDLGQFAVLALAVGLAAVSRSREVLGVRAAWAVLLALVVSLSASVWTGPADFRTASELWVMSVVLLLASQRRLWPLAVAAGLGTLLTAALRVTSL